MERAELTLILERFDVLSYVAEHVERNEGEDEVRLVCTHCGRDHLSVNTSTGSWRCFTCEEYSTDATGRKKPVKGAGRGLQLVEWMEGLDFLDSVARVKEFSSEQLGTLTQLPKNNLVGRQKYGGNLLTVPLPAECVACDVNLPYLNRRGITPEDVTAFGLGFCATGRYANRILFPVWRDGKCIYWQARACWDKTEHVPRNPYDKYRKTLNPARRQGSTMYLGSGDVLLNLEQASQYPRIAITEGPTSCIRTGPDAIATFGKQMSPAQIAQLIAARVRAVDFMWDGPSLNEPLGTRLAMMAAAAQLAPHMDVRIVLLPKGDPGEYSRAQLNWYRAQAAAFSPSTSLTHL